MQVTRIFDLQTAAYILIKPLGVSSTGFTVISCREVVQWEQRETVDFDGVWKANNDYSVWYYK